MESLVESEDDFELCELCRKKFAIREIRVTGSSCSGCAILLQAVDTSTSAYYMFLKTFYGPDGTPYAISLDGQMGDDTTAVVTLTPIQGS
jgi:hypothetical protein